MRMTEIEALCNGFAQCGTAPLWPYLMIFVLTTICLVVTLLLMGKQ